MATHSTLLMFGGDSEERHVSVASAQNLASLTPSPFSDLWFVTPTGEVQSVNLKTLMAHERPFQIQFAPKEKIHIAANVSQAIERLVEMARQSKFSTVFLGFHGTFGEDGRVQALLEKNGIPFTGSGSKSSLLCFNKNEAKSTVQKSGVSIAPGILLNDLAFEKKLRDFFETHKRIVIKPVANGSSIGLHIVKTSEQFERALVEIGKSKSMGTFLAEKYIEGRELTVGIIEQNGNLRALPPSEVIMNEGAHFDYEGKYLGRGSEEITPAKLNDGETKAAQDVALKAHRLLGCRGYSRTDMILLNGVKSDSKNESLIFIETNTLPGLTKASFIPQQLEAAGLNLGQFVADQISQAKAD